MKWKPLDVIIVLILVIVGMTIGGAVIGEIFEPGRMPNDKLGVIVGFLATMVALVALYVKTRLMK